MFLLMQSHNSDGCEIRDKPIWLFRRIEYIHGSLNRTYGEDCVTETLNKTWGTEIKIRNGDIYRVIEPEFIQESVKL